MELRVKWIDIVKGIGIIFVVANHSLNVENSILIKWLNSFFMPMFFIMTGYTIKNVGKKKLFSDLVYLFRIYFIWASIGMVFSFALNIIKRQPINYIQEIVNIIICNNIYNYSLWFILAFAISKFIYSIVLSRINNKFIIECILILAISGIGWGLTQFIDVDIAFKIDIALAMVMFICLGRVMKRYDYSIKEKQSRQLSTLILACIGSFIFGICLNQEVAVFKGQYGNFIYFTISSISGSYIIIIIARMIESYLKRVTAVLSWIGRNTLVILCTHSLCLAILSIVEIYLFRMKINILLSIVNMCLTLIFEMIFIILIDKKVLFSRYNKSIKELIF